MVKAPSGQTQRRSRRRRSRKSGAFKGGDKASPAIDTIAAPPLSAPIAAAPRPAPRPSGRATAPARSRPEAASSDATSKRADAAPQTLYAAIDLGTNNCRLMIASYQNGQFRVVEAFSRIVRLGEDLSRTGELKAEAMDRAIAALSVCASKIKRRQGVKLRAVATQACRAASNGAQFIDRVERETGICLQMISPQEEAHLSVAGCASLLDGVANTAMVLDVGGGSTELSWIDLSHLTRQAISEPRRPARTKAGSQGSGLTHLKSARTLRPHHWLSIPIGVVNLSERFPEPGSHSHPQGAHQWFQSMVDDVRQTLTRHEVPEAIHDHFRSGKAYIIGTSGAITSLAGMHLGLERYDRNLVDGLWLKADDCRGVIDRLLHLGARGRELEPCIGKDRADLVLAGAAILEAVQSLWPSERLRVADRGLREGLLMSMVRKKNRRRSRGKVANPLA